MNFKKKKKISSKKSTGSPANKLRESILAFFYKHRTKKYTAFQILKKLKAKDAELLIRQLELLCEKKVLSKSSSQKYALKTSVAGSSSSSLSEGYVDLAKAGFGYVICDKGTGDIYVSQKNLLGADDGDLVSVELLQAKGRRPEGRVVKILRRARTQVVGIARFFNHHKVAFAQSGRRIYEVLIQIPEHLVVEEYDRVVIQITHYKERPKDLLKGVVIQNLGRESSIDVEMQSILADKGFPLDWNLKILDQVQKISTKIELLPGRRDIRAWDTFTIDPFDAKDFDDALSLQKNEDGIWEIGVHIADVSHYVEEGSALDLEARYRGNSVYLVDRVLPMLPEKLSNELCSLRPNEDKYCFSIVFSMDEDFKIIRHWIGKTIIHSKRRFTYEEAQEIIEGKKDNWSQTLLKLNTVAKDLRKKRMQQGAIDFDSEEIKFSLDKLGFPEKLLVKERKEANMLVEEFMLLANKYVAAYISKKQKNQLPIPFVYRIHDNPDPEKLEMFQTFAKELGILLDFSTPKRISISLNKLSELASKDPKFKVLQPLAIRAMAKAAYSTDNIGHYGLAFPDYAHFTSPIRRYADLLVHRILYANLDGVFRVDPKNLERICLHISNQERKAMEAERESDRYFQVLFMKSKVGEEFTGRVVGMSERGLFIELGETKCEGFLPYDQLGEGIGLHSSRLHAYSEQSIKKWTFGDSIRVKLEDADLDQKELVLSTSV
ncbi:MAG: ribonuclease R [Saprospiraceae bacterium]|nr:ribonuclease R [Saprospiraceae bacterium]